MVWFKFAPLVWGFCIVLFFSCGRSFAADDLSVLTLEQAVALAQARDPGLQGMIHQEQSLRESSVASATLPDPKVSLAFANLPTNTWDFDQEPMTQFKVGITQMFPRGDQLELKQKQLQLQGAAKPWERQERAARLEVQVTEIWLDAWQAEESLRLITGNRYLFEQMSAIAQSHYSSAVGKTRQQDVIRAELELTRLEDRLTQLRQQYDASMALLGQWLGEWRDEADVATELQRPVYALPQALPQIPLRAPADLLQQTDSDWNQLSQYFIHHPAIKMLEQKVAVSDNAVDMARQKYQPEWGLNASYGYREDDPMGNERADFFSVGVTFDVPLFTSNRQDRETAAAVAQVEAVKTEKWLQLKKMLAQFDAIRAQWHRSQQRDHLYRKTLLPRIHQQAEASLTAYTSDNGEFTEVMQDRIAELNAEIDALGIAVQVQKAAARLNYYFVSANLSGVGHDQ